MDRLYDFGGDSAKEHKITCACGHITEVSGPDDAEYNMDIFVKCVCGVSLHFVIPG